MDQVLFTICAVFAGDSVSGIGFILLMIVLGKIDV